ncbi:hypothetical protein [Enterococcus faecalis]|uniref:hypothetical protein n=1 Tax=Enterococcus faecalis TaxID=1351 RepID=UPI004041F889
MEQFELLQQLRNDTKILIIGVVSDYFEEAVKNNDSEMVSALSESLKAVFKG